MEVVEIAAEAITIQQGNVRLSDAIGGKLPAEKAAKPSEC
jgi:hypothetical protein